MAKKAVLAGATGLVGSHLLPLLCQNYDQVAAFTRRPLSFSAPNLKELPFEELHKSDWAPVDHAYCCLGITIAKAGSQAAFRAVDHDLVVEFAKAALVNGATQFGLVSSVGANKRSPAFYLRVKGETEEDIAGLGYEGVQIAQPSFLLGDRDQTRLVEEVGILAAKVIGPLLIGPLSKYRAIEAQLVAQALLRAVQTDKSGIHRLDYQALAAK
jgi:uncharacterized protein YbjT (DUF2867 family)